MSSGYDERLLASAPVATRAEKQEGYDINLFKEQANGREPTVSPPPLPVLSANHSSAEVAGYSPYAQPPALPWYRTRKWMFIFFLGAIVVIAAIIGGAVGGTVGHNKGGQVVATKDAGTGGGGAEGSGSNSTQTIHKDHDAGSNLTATATATGSDGGGS